MLLQNIIIQQAGIYTVANIKIEEGIIKSVTTRPLLNQDICKYKFFITPGFVNSHLHPSQLTDRGTLDGLSISKLLSAMHHSNKKTDQDRYLHALFVLIDTIKSGATTIYSVASNPMPIIKAYATLGIRGAVTCFFNDVWEGEGTAPKLTNKDSVEEIFNQFYVHKSNYTDIHIGSASLQTASNDLLRLFDRIAHKYNIKVNLHVSEGARSVELCKRYRGTTPVRLLAELGILNSRWNLIHVTNIDSEEIKIIADSGANVTLCPVSNAKTGVGIAPFTDLIRNNVTITLGTDACSNNNSNNILNEAYFTSLLCNAINRDPNYINETKLLQWLTINGYQTLGMHQSGLISAGEPADLLLWSIEESSFVPIYHKNYYSTIFSNAADIKPHTVLINGIKVIDNYNFLLLNEIDLLQSINNNFLN